jgi:hypothetical protein
MREMLASHRHLATYLRALELIAPLATRLIQVESPPPARDDAQIIARPNRYFVEHNIASVGIAPPLLRRKLWKLHSSIIKARCAALGATFLGAPEAAIEDDFLRPEFFRDATHANGAYVDLVLQQLEAL